MSYALISLCILRLPTLCVNRWFVKFYAFQNVLFDKITTTIGLIIVPNNINKHCFQGHKYLCRLCYFFVGCTTCEYGHAFSNLPLLTGSTYRVCQGNVASKACRIINGRFPLQLHGHTLWGVLVMSLRFTGSLARQMIWDQLT